MKNQLKCRVTISGQFQRVEQSLAMDSSKRVNCCKKAAVCLDADSIF